jgi:hypothetical protein
VTISHGSETAECAAHRRLGRRSSIRRVSVMNDGVGRGLSAIKCNGPSWPPLGPKQLFTSLGEPETGFMLILKSWGSQGSLLPSGVRIGIGRNPRVHASL